MKEKKIYFRRLDIVRDLSCILVLLYHLNILKGGFLAVCTFFTLSGYVTCMSALNNEKFSLKSYYLGRLKKLYIPLLVVTFITVFIAKIDSTINWINLKQETTSVIFGYNNFWQLNANLDYFTRNVNSPFTHFWYISILLQLDLIFPIIFVLLKKLENRTKKGISTAIIILLTAGTTCLFYYLSKTQDIMIVYYNTLARSFSVFLGILLALIHYKHNFKISQIFKRSSTLFFIIYCIALIGLCIFMPSETKNYAIYMILTTLISARLIEYSAKESKKTTKYDKQIRSLSKISYEIYLTQYPVIFFMQNVPINDVLKVFLIIILTLVSSFILHVLIDFSVKRKIWKIIKVILCGVIIVFGCYVVITEEDHSAEMKELENRLNENLKVIEERNNEYLNKVNEEKEEWNTKLENMENAESKIAETVKKLPVVGIGDSVLLGCIDELYKTFPNGYFDGKISRSIIGSKDLLISLKNKGKLGDTLILGLATNGDYSDRVNKGLMEILGEREIYWINAVGADDPRFNDRFKEFAKNYPNIHIVDWEKAAKNHPEYFYADGIHVKGTGIKAYANTIYETIYNNYLEKYNIKKNEIIQKHEDELKDKISFYGNSVLTNAFSILNKKISNASFNAKSDYTFDILYKDIKEKVENKTLEHQVILLFDKETDISEDEYKELVDLCKDYEIYIFNLTDKNYSLLNENVKIIDFYSEIKKNDEYIFADNIHLSEAGNEALVDLIVNTIEKK